MRCCSAWKRAMGTPNCLRVRVYSVVASRVACSTPDRLGAEGGHAQVEGRRDAREGLALLAQQRVPGERHAGQLDVGGALPVDGRVRDELHAG